MTETRLLAYPELLIVPHLHLLRPRRGLIKERSLPLVIIPAYRTTIARTRQRNTLLLSLLLPLLAVLQRVNRRWNRLQLFLLLTYSLLSQALKVQGQRLRLLSLLVPRRPSLILLKALERLRKLLHPSQVARHRPRPFARPLPYPLGEQMERGIAR